MNLTKNRIIKNNLRSNNISELRLAYTLGINRSTVSNKLQLPLSKTAYKKMLSAIKKIVTERTANNERK